MREGLQETWVQSLGQKIPRRRKWQPALVFLPGKFHGQRSLVGYSLWGCRIVWGTLTSWYLVSLLPVSIIHVSVILLVGFWSWEISFIMWGCRFPVKWWDSPPPSGDLEPANHYTPRKKPARELKSPWAPKFEQKPALFVPIELL